MTLRCMCTCVCVCVCVHMCRPARAHSAAPVNMPLTLSHQYSRLLLSSFPQPPKRILLNCPGQFGTELSADSACPVCFAIMYKYCNLNFSKFKFYARKCVKLTDMIYFFVCWINLSLLEGTNVVWSVCVRVGVRVCVCVCVLVA